jgi:phosphate transport system substrate-binding protein
MISAPLDLEVGKLNEMRPGSIDSARLSPHVVGEARVAFAVHPSNKVARMSAAQLTDILTGKIRNWREVGGSDQAIIVVTAQPGDGLRSMVESKLLQGSDLAKDARALMNATQITKAVAQLPGAIGIVASSAIDPSVAELASDVQITQPLILVTVGETTSQIDRVVEAVAKVGQF